MADAFQPKFADLVRNYTTTSGTDDFVLGAAVNGFASLTDACAVGDTFYYSAIGVDNPGDTEVGRGTLLAGGVIQRDPIDGAKTNFKNGTTAIALVAASEWFDAAEAARARAGATNVKSFGAKGDGTTDDRTAIQAALDHIGVIGGGALYFPEGVFLVSGPLTVHPRTLIRGAGRQASVIMSAHEGGGGANAGESVRNGSGLVSSSPINGSTPFHFVIEDISIQNSNPANVGAAYYDSGGTYISCRNVAFGGFRYGIVLDQSELVDIDLCEIGSQNSGGAGVWIVNGQDLTPGAASGFTNRISIKRCQINQNLDVYGIVDDGGSAHVFEDNNYNGCLNHIRAANVIPLDIRGGEFESAASHCILLDSLSRAGAGVGGSIVAVRGGLFSATAGHASIYGQNAPGQLQVDGLPLFAGGGGTNAICGASNFAALWLLSYSNQTGLASISDGSAVYVNVDAASPDGFIANGVTCASGEVSASNIGSAAGHAEADFLQTANNLSEVANKIAAAKNLGTGVVLGQGAVQVSHTGDSNAFTLASVNLPANAMGANGQLVVEALFSMNNSANGKTVQIKLGGSAIKDLTISSQFGIAVRFRLANQNAANAQVAENSSISSYGNNNRNLYAIDTTKDQAIAFVGQLADPADVVRLESYLVILYPKD